jgi:hypothetical protein
MQLRGLVVGLGTPAVRDTVSKKTEGFLGFRCFLPSRDFARLNASPGLGREGQVWGRGKAPRFGLFTRKKNLPAGLLIGLERFKKKPSNPVFLLAEVIKTNTCWFLPSWFFFQRLRSQPILSLGHLVFFWLKS